MDQKLINVHKNPNDSQNYHDENHDEIEFYLGNSDNSGDTREYYGLNLIGRIWFYDCPFHMSQSFL